MTIQIIKPMPSTPMPGARTGDALPEQGDFFDLIQQTSSDQSNHNAVNGDVSKVSSDKSAKPNKPTKHSDKEQKPLDLMSLTEQSLANNALLQTTIKSTVNHQALSDEKPPLPSSKASQNQADIKQVLKTTQSLHTKHSSSVLPSLKPNALTESMKVLQPNNVAEQAKVQALESSVMAAADFKLPAADIANNKINVTNNVSKDISKVDSKDNATLQHITLDREQQEASATANTNDVNLHSNQPSEEVQFSETLTKAQTPTNDQSSKAVQSLSALGSVIQAQVSAAMPNHAPILPNNIMSDSNTQVSTVSQSKNDDYEMQLESTPDLTDAHIKESYMANIKIYPPELGSVVAKLKVDKQNAQLVIVTENDRVKNIVEANLPTLREHFLQSNLTLTHIQVQTATSGTGDQNQNRQPQADNFLPDTQSSGTQSNSALTQSPKDPQKAGDKIIDTYA